MKSMVIFSAIVALSVAQYQGYNKPLGQPGLERSARVLEQTFDRRPDGSYVFGFNTENGISAQEEGTLSVPGPEGPAIGVRGFFKHTLIDGVPVDIQYTADENGYQPRGSILPTPPPTPPAILRALAYIAANYKGTDNTYQPPRRYK